MTFEELKEEAKKMGADVDTEDITFESADGWTCTTYWKDGDISMNEVLIAEHRTPDQMLAIMKALQ